MAAYGDHLNSLRRVTRYPTAMVSSNTPATAADSSRMVAAHHASGSPEVSMRTVWPRARDTAYSTSPGMPMHAASASAPSASRRSPLQPPVRPRRLRAERPPMLSRYSASATGMSRYAWRTTWEMRSTQSIDERDGFSVVD
ncbi:hypothetical protein GCM10025876_20310 [Demequina litorisediminis]|uniref:Uncharacterized protein n=1 Tax=Demequina litorisediminis TaxID=1849022 RepID=A0ABQ6IGF9_9MICO|nr:hypothetical protein GCM10025876_20310 [Demequina litorisediminis]